MAPEFLPFLAFVALAVIVISALCASAMMLVLVRHKKERRRALRVASALTFSAVVVAVLLLVVLGKSIRKQYFLNEPFVSACGSGDLAEAQRLLSSGASPDAYGVDCVETALIAASRSGHRDIVTLLLRNGANVALKDIEGKTAFERAKEAGEPEIASLLEHVGVSGNTKRH
jgi:general stress protein CsbA